MATNKRSDKKSLTNSKKARKRLLAKPNKNHTQQPNSLAKEKDLARNRTGLQKRLRWDEQGVIESPSFWRDLHTQYFREVEPSEFDAMKP